MDNFNQISKILKSSLKKKITITAATVVTFLMTGVVSYSIINDKDITEVQQPCWTNIWVGLDTSEIDREGGEIINNAKIKVNNQEKENIKLHGIYVDTSESNKSFSIINDGEINITNSKNSSVYGIYGRAGNEKSEIINNGNIIINNTRVQNFLDNRENPAGIAINGRNTVAINKGKIFAKGMGVAGMAASQGATAINDKGGIIDITEGKFSYGMYGERANLINNGSILLSFGEGDTSNVNQNMAIYNYEGAAVNNGSVVITDRTKEQLKDLSLSSIFYGHILNNGMIKDSNGEAVIVGDGLELTQDTEASNVANMIDASDNKVINVTKSDIKLKASDNVEINANVLNVAGHRLTIANTTLGNSIAFNGTTINIDKFGQVKLGDKELNSFGSLTINNGVINGSKNAKVAQDEHWDIVFDDTMDTLLTLNNTVVQNATIGNIAGAPVPLVGVQNNIDIYGDTYFDNSVIQATNINIGNATELPKENKLHLSTDSKITGWGNLNIGTNGQLVLDVAEDGLTGLSTSQVKITGDSIDGNGDILLNTSNLTGSGKVVHLGTGTITQENLSTVDVTGFNGNKGVYVANGIKIDEDGNATTKLTYNTKLFEDDKINAVNNAAMNANDLFENLDLNLRKHQMEKIYHSSIFAKTVKASYTGVKLVEDTLRELPTTTEVGKWTAMGTGLHNVNKNKEHGFENKIDTSGLVATMEYGLDSTTSVGVALSGAYQDVKAGTGKADGQLMYVGTFAKKQYGSYKVTAGLGYQYGRYDADNTTGYASSSDKYSSNTFSTYVERRYSMNVGDSVSIEPKAKLGYTYINQEDAKDANIGVSSAKVSTVDAEIGADLVKTIAIEKGKVDVAFGASYVRAMGDVDKDFKGEFVKSNGSFDVVGANLAKNTGKFDLSVKVTKESGMFYKGGVSYKVGSDKTRDYGVNVGIGYRF